MDTGLAPITYSSIHCHLSTWPRSSDRWASRTNHLFFHPLPPRPLLPSLAPITYAFIHCHRQGRSSPPTVRALAPITYAFIHCHTEAEHGLDLRDQSRTNHLCIHPLPPSAPPASRQANRPRTNHHFVHLLPHVNRPREPHYCPLAPITISYIYFHSPKRRRIESGMSSHQSPIQLSTATGCCVRPNNSRTPRTNHLFNDPLPRPGVVDGKRVTIPRTNHLFN